MKTIKFLKLAIWMQIVFYVICATSILCFYFDHNSIGIILSYFWIINPIGPVCCAVGLIKSISERKDIQSRKIIGNKWIWFIILFVITTCVYLISGGLMVIFTGGV